MYQFLDNKVKNFSKISQFIFYTLFFFLVAKTYQTKIFAQETSDLSGQNFYYIYPLRIELNKSLLENMVLDQGYEVHCTSNETTIDLETFGQLSDFDGMHVFHGSDEFELNFENATIPLFRSSDSESRVTTHSSLEGYFGSINYLNKSFDIEKNLLNTGVANKLMTSREQCVYKYNNLKMAETLCGMLKNKEKCALHQIIPYTNYYVYSTQDQKNAGEIDLRHIIDEYDLDCRLLSQSWSEAIKLDPDLSNRISYGKFNEIKNSLSQLPLQLPDLYRLAFIVISPVQDPEIDGTEFWFKKIDPNTIPNNVDKPRNVPIVIAFKIPDFATNRSQILSPDINFNQPLEDLEPRLYNSLELTHQIITTYQTQVNILQDETKETRQNLFEEAQKKHPNPIINCQDLPECDETIPKNELRATLVKIINGSHLDCSSPNPEPKKLFEDARYIGTSANFEDSTNSGRVFKPNFQPTIYPSQNNVQFDWELFVNPANKNNDLNQKMPVQIHLVAPLGLRYEQIVESLEGFFTKEFFDKHKKNNVLYDVDGQPTGKAPEYYPIKYTNSNYNSSQVHVYTDPPGCVPPNCEIKTIGANVSLQGDNDFYILGARLGWMVRKIQEGLQPKDSPAHDYLMTCERTEDMFLGTCGSKYAGPVVISGGGKCEPINNPNNPCDVQKLKEALKNSSWGGSLSDRELEARATNASIICNAESGGVPNIINDLCLQGITLDYSVGLFQINLLAHDIKNGDRRTDSVKYPCHSYLRYNQATNYCTVLDQSGVNTCANILQQPNENIQKALEMSEGFRSFRLPGRVWSTAKPEHCDIP